MKTDEQKTDFNREFSGCLLRLGCDIKLPDLLSTLGNDHVTGEGCIFTVQYWSAVNYVPAFFPVQPISQGRGRKKQYLYSVHAVELPIKVQKTKFAGEPTIFFFAPYFGLAREVVKRFRERDSSITFERIALQGLLDHLGSAEKSPSLPVSVRVLRWAARVEGDGAEGKMITLAGNNLMKSNSYPVVAKSPATVRSLKTITRTLVDMTAKGEFPPGTVDFLSNVKKLADSIPSDAKDLVFKTQAATIGFNRIVRLLNEKASKRKHEVKIVLDVHGNIRIRAPFDSVATNAFLDLMNVFAKSKVLEQTKVCPLDREDETDQNRGVA